MNGKRPIWQCIYCGRWMVDRRARRTIRTKQGKFHACVVCNLLIEGGVVRAKSISGRQRVIGKIFENVHTGVETPDGITLSVIGPSGHVTTVPSWLYDTGRDLLDGTDRPREG